MSFQQLFSRPWVAITAAVLAVSGIFGTGYAIGSYKLNNDHKIEIIELNREWAQKLQDEKDKFRDYKEAKAEEKANNLTAALEEMRKRRENEK